jgi:hypothetical protein
MSTRDSGFSGRLPCGRGFWIRPGPGQAKDVGTPAAAVMPPLTARPAIQGCLELPDRRLPRLLESAERR